MVERLVDRLTDRIMTDKSIAEDMREWYKYALLRIIETSVSFCFILLIGIVLGCFVPMCLFCLFFSLLRNRTGGFHFEKTWQCFLGSGACVVIVRFTEKYTGGYPALIYSLLFVSAVIIALVGTVNHPNINMNIRELRESKKVARLILAGELATVVIFELIGVERIYINYMILAIIMCAALIILAKLKNQEVIIYEQQNK